MITLKIIRAWTLVLTVWSLAGTGCAVDPPEPPMSARVDEPIGVQMMRIVPELRGQRFNNLLSFESPSDLVFLQSQNRIWIDELRAHTGRTSARIDGGRAHVKLSALIAAGTFPGDWTLVGGYFYSPTRTEITFTCYVGEARVAQRKVALQAGRWTPVMLDVSQLSMAKGFIMPDARLTLSFQCDSATTVWFDDLMVVNNDQLIYGDAQAEPSLSGGWTIRKRGLNYICDAPGRFNFKLLTAEVSHIGWSLREVNGLRARFESNGPQKSLSVYSDGRAYWDGQYRPLSATTAEPQYVAAHRSHGSIKIAEEIGRVNRNTPGDADNDGYNEARGAYQIHAQAPRLELMILPREAPLMRPVLEITHLPPGKLSVIVQGRLIDETTRLEDGTVLIDIPARVIRPTSVSVKVE